MGVSARAPKMSSETRGAFVAVCVALCTLGARAASMRPGPMDTYANSEYYARDVGVETVDLQGTRYCFPRAARHARPAVADVFLKSTIPLEVRRERVMMSDGAVVGSVARQRGRGRV